MSLSRLSLSPRLAFGMALASILAEPLAAQSRGAVSTDVTVGPSTGWGGPRNLDDRNGYAGELTIGRRTRPDDETTRMVALTIGSHLSLQNKCGCPSFPSINHLGLLGGLERRGRLGAVRAMAGPAFYAGDGASGMGGQLHLDAAAGVSHLELVLAARGSVVVRFTGEVLGLSSLQFGVRLQ